jgi:tRNA (guanine37-N1)-methyltransferase
MLRFEVLTLFPKVIQAYLAESILGKAQQNGLLSVTVTDIRDFAEGKHRVVDDTPYGGGAGMVMKLEPIVGAIESAKLRLADPRIVLTSPRGKRFDHSVARAWNQEARDTVIICGRYEGVDERVLQFIDEEVSIGDLVLTGGELAALAMIDASARLYRGVLGNDQSARAETFEEGLLEYGQFTRPPVFRGIPVPPVLQSGDHSRIARWRRWHSLKLTAQRRPDLFHRLRLSAEDQKLLTLTEAEL